MEEVDILMATYNTKIEYLKKQIESILNQTYKNINLLISDDCSPNKEVEKTLEEYAKKDKRIKIYKTEHNLGYTKNFEYLLQKSTSKYICFSDHDDIWYPQKIEKSLEKLKQDDVDLVYCNCHQIDENDQIIKQDYFKYKNMPLIKKHSKLAISRYAGIGCSQLFTKEVKEKALPFLKSVIAHDWLIGFIANEGKGISHINEALFGYRLHKSNVFGGRSLKQNLYLWKEKNGNSIESYSKYRQEKVIDKAYLYGAKMCLEYSQKLQDEKSEKWIKKLIKYYESIKKSKYINFRFISFFRFLGGKNLTKKLVKEILIFHFPFICFLYFRKIEK